MNYITAMNEVYENYFANKEKLEADHTLATKVIARVTHDITSRLMDDNITVFDYLVCIKNPIALYFLPDSLVHQHLKQRELFKYINAIPAMNQLLLMIALNQFSKKVVDFDYTPENYTEIISTLIRNIGRNFKSTNEKELPK